MYKQHGNGYWNEDNCRNEALKYKTRTQFYKGSPGAYYSAKRNGWLNNYDWFVDGNVEASKQRIKWNYESCYALAKTCSKKSEMRSKNGRAFKVARDNGWLSDYTWFMSDYDVRHQPKPMRVKWTYEKCREIAQKYDTMSKFHKENGSVYKISKRHGWIDDFDWLKRGASATPYSKQDKIDNVYVYIFLEQHAVYVGRTVNPSSRDKSHRENNKSSVFRFAKNNCIDIPQMTILEQGLTLDEGLEKEDSYRMKYQDDGWTILNIAKTGIGSGSLGLLAKGKWNYESCFLEAKKYTTLKEFRKLSASAYNKSLRYGWLSDYTWLNSIKQEYALWTYEKCYEAAKHCKSKTQFLKHNSHAFSKASKEGWINDYTWFSDPPREWNYETCYTEAKKYDKLSEFIKNAGAAYRTARINGWMKDYIWMTKRNISKKIVIQYSMDNKFISEFQSVHEAAEKTGISYSGISACCNGKLKQHGGFMWEFKNKGELNVIPVC